MEKKKKSKEVSKETVLNLALVLSREGLNSVQYRQRSQRTATTYTVVTKHSNTHL